jgi:hypothetical protein
VDFRGLLRRDYLDYVFKIDKDGTFNNENLNSFITEVLEYAHDFDKHRDLYEYYIALKFIFNITDNEIGRDACARVGEILLRELVNTGNKYASQVCEIKF